MIETTENIDKSRLKGSRPDLEQIETLIRGEKPFLREQYNVKSIGVFGSFARGEQKAKSDLDILVELDGRIGFFKFLEMEEYLENLLGVKVDLVSRKALKPRIGRFILKELITI